MISQNEVKISQYADDTTLFLDGSKESLLSALQVLENFRKMSGLKLNKKTPEALWIGVYSLDHFLSLPLWHNSLIRIDNNPVFYQSWYSKGIRNVADLLKDRNVFLSLHELKHRFDVKTNFLPLLGLQSRSLQSLREKCKRQSLCRRL